MKDARFATRVALLGLACASLFLGGCGEGEVFFPTTGSSTTTGSGGTGAGTSQGGGGTSQGGGGSGGATSQGGGGNGGTTTQGGGGSGGSTGECAVAADCDAKKGGPAACGTWACNGGVCEASSPGCVDTDHDGYGTGAGCACAGLDCDDTDDTIGPSASATCYSGPAPTKNTGACHDGLTTCNAGVWSPCSGEVIPSGEACNNEDDDCDGTIDDGLGNFVCGLGACQATIAACTAGKTGVCTPGAAAASDATCDGVDSDCDGAVDEDCSTNCIYVTLGGNDGSGNGTLLLPYKTIQKGISAAVANPAGPQNVCVAAGAICGTSVAPITGVYGNSGNTTVTMANGVSVLGNYESTTGSRCPTAIPTFTTTTIQPQTAEGVTFPSTVVKPTVLDGVRVERFNAGNSGTTAGVTVNGAKGAVISNVRIDNAPAVMTSYGVNVINGADVVLSRDRIDAGDGSAESIAVRSVGSKVALQNNCNSLDAFGRCSTACGGPNGVTYASIRGRTQPSNGISYGVLLQDSPDSTIETSALCAADGDTAAMIRIAGEGANIVIRANYITAFNGHLDSHGIWMEDCNDAAPWIVDNNRIQATGDAAITRVDGIRAIGACHPVIDGNLQITGGGEGNASNPTGIRCGANAQGVASKCVVLGNRKIEGSVAGFPPIATGVRCDDGGCNRIAGNLITGRGGLASIGVWLGSTGTFVDDNEIRGGCSGVATGVRTEDAYARLQNNRIFGYTSADCGLGGSNGNPTESYGVRAFNDAGSHELDVHSNNIDAGGPTTGVANTCNGRALAIDIGPVVPGSAMGIFRNNILRAGTCTTSRYNVLESNNIADPRIFENNDLDPTGAPTALYRDEAMNDLDITEINTLLGALVSANLSVDPTFVNYPSDFHLQATSQCIGAGTPTGIPLTDFEGTVRDLAKPDIGADEN